MNTLYQQLNQTQQQMPIGQKSSQLKNNDVFKKILNSSNPKELLNSMISSNPNLQLLMQSMNSSGMTPKQFFYTYAQQKGVDPEQFINSLKGA